MKLKASKSQRSASMLTVKVTAHRPQRAVTSVTRSAHCSTSCQPSRVGGRILLADRYACEACAYIDPAQCAHVLVVPRRQVLAALSGID